MSPMRVLVAFSNRSGSTGGTAEIIAAVLRASGLSVDSRAKEEVTDVTPYRAVILGSGMYLPARATDGGGFLERHAAALRDRDVWLFSTGPIGAHVGQCGAAQPEERPVQIVGRAIGARGTAVFGTLGLPVGKDPVAALLPADRREVRSWALGIAATLGAPTPRPVRHRYHWHRAPAPS